MRLPCGDALAGTNPADVVGWRPVRIPSGRTIGVLSGLTVVAFLLALGTFDVYIAVLAQVLLLATIVAGVLALVGASLGRRHQH
jgi:hypothetical protein